MQKYLNYTLLFLICFIVFTLHFIIRTHKTNFDNFMPTYTYKFFDFEDNESEIYNVSAIKIKIEDRNRNRTIINEDIFGPIHKETPIIVILTAKFDASLRYLLASLNCVKGIETALLIFSHSYYDENVNGIIKTIDYCRVIQIFYPYSLQTHPNLFPGFSPNDCPHDMKTKDAIKRNCTGAYYPDLKGHYRSPEKTEEKHHWWWTVNEVFENMPFSVNYSGFAVFLQDDVVFIEDFLYMAMYMQEVSESFPRANIYSFSTPMDSVYESEEDNCAKIEFAPWNPVDHSEVMGFDVNTWNKIVSRYHLFCFVDEQDWAMSLFQLSMNMDETGDEKLGVIFPVIPRAYKIGHGGYAYDNLKVFENAYHVLSEQRTEGNVWFPKVLHMHAAVDVDIPELKQEFEIELGGGWNDPRDWALCSNLTKTKIKKVIFDSAYYLRRHRDL